MLSLGFRGTDVMSKKRMKKRSPCRGGYFGAFGGQFVPDTLMSVLSELESQYKTARKDREFRKELDYYLRFYAGRPTPLYFAKNLTRKLWKLITSSGIHSEWHRTTEASG